MAKIAIIRHSSLASGSFIIVEQQESYNLMGVLKLPQPSPIDVCRSTLKLENRP